MDEEQQEACCKSGAKLHPITEIDLETGEIIYDNEKEISSGLREENFPAPEQRNSNGSENKKAAAETPTDRYTGTHTSEPDAGCGGQSCLGLLGRDVPAESETGGTGTEAASLTLPPGKEGMRFQRTTVHSIQLSEEDEARMQRPLAVLNSALPVSEEPYTQSDYGNARRFLDRNGACVRYCPEEKRWYLYNGAKWVPSPEEEVQRQVRNALFRSHEEEQAQLEAEHNNAEAAKSEAARIRCGKMSTIKNCMEAAALDCFIHPYQFDADIYKFHAANGSVHLKTFERTLYHTSGDFNTKTARAELYEGAVDAQDDCPMWVRFVKQCCMYDKDLYLYVQAAAGYSILTGDIREQKAFCLLGSGRNGKSLFINVLAYIAGDYAKKLESSVLCTDRYGRKSDETEKELYRIRGSRFVYSNEFSQSSILNESFLKTITDGGMITCRPMYRESLEYLPTYTLWFSTNHMPNLRAMDEGIRRRIVVIPFRNHLKPEEVDRNLEAKLLSEANGILAWLLQGYYRYHHSGLVPPQAVIDATEGYFEEQDPVQRFVSEYYEVDASGKLYARGIYRDYKIWCEENGEEVKSQKFLGMELLRLGIKREKDDKGNFYRLRRKVE